MFLPRIFRPVAAVILVTAAHAQSRPAEPLEPFAVIVIDEDTQQPISVYSYWYRVEAASGYEAAEWEWKTAKTGIGGLKLDLPRSCQLTFCARAAGYEYDTDCIAHYSIKRDDWQRQIRHALRRGSTITGRVIDAATSQPVANVRVSPTVFHNPGLDPDHDRSVFSGPDGRFEVSGIRLELGSLAFEHADYLPTTWYPYDFEADAVRPTSDITVPLRTGEPIFGVVRRPDGQPIAGATVQSGEGKEVQTAADGKFRILSVKKHSSDDSLQVKVKKTGYMEYRQTPRSIPEDGLEVTLEPLWQINGRVVGPGGEPVTHFEVMAGPGKNPDRFNCANAEFTDDDGHFSIAIDTLQTWLGWTAADGKHVEGQHWLAVRADGSAVWEGCVPYDFTGANVSVSLSAGVSVTGRLTGIGSGFQGGEAVLVPERPPSTPYAVSENASALIGTRKRAISPDGSLRFDHVRPDKYVLTASGAGITPRTIALEVSGEDVDLGVLDVQATGRIAGRIFGRDGQPWEFADGVLYHPLAGEHGQRNFKAAEDGTFTLEDVPAGQASVGAQYLGGDITWADTVTVNVLPGSEVAVIINDPDRSRDLRFRIEIGDNSEAQGKTGTGMAAERRVENVTTIDPWFRIDLQPLKEASGTLPDMSDWRRPNAEGLIALPDVPAGRYRLRVFDWLLTRGFGDGLLYENDIEVRMENEPFPVPLGAGAITGQLNVTNKIRRMPQVIAVEINGRTHPRRARCDRHGNFCVRYLPPGEYTLHGHEDANGYCRLAAVPVNNDITDVGPHALTAGRAIRGSVRWTQPIDPPTTVRAIGAGGIALEALDFKGQNGEPFAISNLWPGEWRLTVERGGEIMLERSVTLSAQEDVILDVRLDPP